MQLRFLQTSSAALRAGSWLTRERLHAYPRIIGSALLLAFVLLVATAQNAKDRWDRPLGVDFSGVWVAGRAVLAGHPAAPYDHTANAAAQAAAFGPSDSFLPWPYPPYFLAIAAGAAALPYLVALALWQGTTGALYLAAVLRAVRGAGFARREVLIAAAAFPAAAINLMHGQNGFLSAGLIALGGFRLPARPIAAGVLLGLLAYKPQFALAVPVAILAGAHARAFVAAALTVVALTAISLVAFGLEPWQAFWSNLAFTRHVILEAGGLESYKLQSAFAAVRLLGGSLSLAYATQGVVAIAALSALAWLWRARCDIRLKVAGLAVASLLSTPYVVDYDMAMLGPAIAALAAYGAERGFVAWGKTILAVAWLAPLLARPVAMTFLLPVGLIAVATVFAFIVVQASADIGMRMGSRRDAEEAVEA